MINLQKLAEELKTAQEHLATAQTILQYARNHYEKEQTKRINKSAFDRWYAASADYHREFARQNPALISTRKAYDIANDWPRCGESWPMTPSEMKHDEVLKLHKEGPYLF